MDFTIKPLASISDLATIGAMRIKELYDARDVAAMLRAQSRTFSHVVHTLKGATMGTTPQAIAEAARKRVAELKAKKANTPKSTAAKSKPNGKAKAAKKSVQRQSRASEADLKKVANMYNAGKTVSEISDAMGWTVKGDWPYSYTYGILKRLRADGAVSTKRGKK